MATVGRKLALGSTARGLSFLVSAACSVVVTPIIVHSLGDHDYGLWALIGTVVGYYSLLDLGLGAAVTRHIATAFGEGDRDKGNRVFNTALGLYCVIGTLVFCLGLFLAAGTPFFVKNPRDAEALWKMFIILGASAGLGFPRRALAGTLYANFEYDTTSRFDLLSIVLRALLNIAVVKLKFGVVALAWSVLISDLPALSLYFRAVQVKLPALSWDLKFWSKDTTRQLFSFGSYAFLARIADLVRFQVDAFVIAAFVGVSAVAHYNIASTLAQQYIAIVAALVGVFQSVFSQQFGAGDRERMESTFHFATKISMMISSFVAFGLIAWGRPFIVRWMGPSYTDAYLLLVVLVSGFVVALWQNPSISLLYSFAKHKYYAWFNTIEAVANLGLSLWLVRRFGMVGVALGTFIPMFLMKTIVQPIYVCFVTGFGYRRYLVCCGKTLVRILIALVVPVILTVRFAESNYIALGILGLISGLSYAMVNWLTQFTREESDQLERAILPATIRQAVGRAV